MTLLSCSKESECLSWAQRVRQALCAQGLETPMVPLEAPIAERQRVIQVHLRAVLQQLGIDSASEDFEKTPERVARMYLEELFRGLDYRNFPSLVFSRVLGAGLVVTHGITVKTQCAHHLVMVEGEASVAYYPHERVIGLSKLNRLVNFFARRPQLQERLTAQCCVALQTVLETQDVAVRLRAKHHCVRSRGVTDQHTETTTFSCEGRFRTSPLNFWSDV